MNMRGLAALEDANLPRMDSCSGSGWTCTEVFRALLREAVVLVLLVRVPVERADFLEELLFEFLEEVLPERDFEVFAIISRYSLSP